MDVGGTDRYWRDVGIDFLRRNGISITILNIDEIDNDCIDDVSDCIEFVVGDGCNLNYADDEFDLCHSNSVIEHVVTWSAMCSMASEMKRVSKAVYLQTPNYWFPIDPHFPKMPLFHWFPRPIRAWAIRNLPIATIGRIRDIGRSFEATDGARLLCSKQITYLFPKAECKTEKFLFLPKSHIVMQRGC